MFWFTNEWYVFDGAIDKKTCDRIIKGDDIERSTDFSEQEGRWSIATIDKNKHPYSEETTKKGRKGDLDDPSYRKSDVYWTHEQWLYDLIWPYMLQANKLSGWNLDIIAAEDMQITRYKKGGFYDFHRDGISDNLSTFDWPNNPLMHGNVRKLSMTLVLNDDFEGGALEFATIFEGECLITPIKAKAGDMIFFPSGLEHRVAPVTKGVRYSLVSWFCGPPVR